jgi:hypothetical protein
MVQMKKVTLKQTWIDDDNHFLKGYFANEIESVEIGWLKLLCSKLKLFLNGFNKKTVYNALLRRK